jgi:hypothetical protein
VRTTRKLFESGPCISVSALVLCVLDVVESGDETKVLLNGQVIEEPRIVGHEREFALRRDGVELQVVAGDVDRAMSRTNDSRQSAESAGLAGAVLTDQPHDLAALNRERKLIHRRELAVPLHEVPYPNRVMGHLYLLVRLLM